MLIELQCLVDLSILYLIGVLSHHRFEFLGRGYAQLASECLLELLLVDIAIIIILEGGLDLLHQHLILLRSFVGLQPVVS